MDNTQKWYLGMVQWGAKLNMFYSHFVDETKIMAIADKKEQNRYWSYSVALFSFAEVLAVATMITGYNFTHPLGRAFLAINIFTFSMLILFSVKFILLEKRNHVFKTRWYLPLFIFVYFLLSVSFAVVAFFNTKFTDYPEDLGKISVEVNSIYFLTIFVPCYLTYVIFCYYAYMKLFAKVYRDNYYGKKRTIF